MATLSMRIAVPSDMAKTTLTLKQARHKNEPVLLLGFARDEELLRCLRANFTSTRWSSSLKTWYLPDAENLPAKLSELLADAAIIDDRGLCNPSDKVEKIKTVTSAEKSEINFLQPLTTEHLKKIEQFTAWMRSRRYAENTIGTYTDGLRIFLRHFAAKPIELISNEDLIDFNNRYILANKLSASYQNQVINAVKLFFRTQQSRMMDVALVHRPKREHRLPNVLSKEEVKRILDSHVNYKHKVMLSLIYACGLRRSELLNLKPKDVNSDRGVIVIRQSKGKKDRIAPISENMINILRSYYKMYKPSFWLFEGQVKGEQYSGESLQKVLSQALVKAKIDKPVTLHWLRHSYATHLLEKGTDLRYIQELLGHNSSRTTEIYTHVSTKSIQKIISPFDDL